MEAETDTTPTREKLLGLIDDMELISRELIENAVAPKQKKMSASDHADLVSLLIEKDKELKVTMKLALEQGQVEEKIRTLSDEVKRQDDAIRELQAKLKDAETVLSTAIFQARRKLESIERSNKNPVSSEDLIRFAHRISASNAVCAPLNWEQGDPRRPYPTDIEMRLGFLGRPDAGLSTLAAAGTAGTASATTSAGIGAAAGAAYQATPTRVPDFGLASGPQDPSVGGGQFPVSGGPSPKLQHGASPHHHQHSASHHPGGPPPPHGQFSWQGGEMSMSLRDGTLVNLEQHHSRDAGGHPQKAGAGAGDEVEVMSTDSSSSSSTDSN